MNSGTMLKALALAPLAAPVLYWLIMLLLVLSDPVRRGHALQSAVEALGLILLLGAPIAYAATAIVLAPALWLRRRAGTLPFVTLAAVGGAATSILLRPWLHGELVSVPLDAWHGALLGSAVALVFNRLAPASQ